MDDPSLLAVGRPRDANPGNQVSIACRRSLQGIAQPQGERQARFDSPLILREYGDAPLCEGNKRCALGDVIGGGNSPGQAEQGSPVLFQPGNCDGLRTGVEGRSQSAPEDERSVESVRIVVVYQNAQRSYANFYRVLLMAPKHIVVDFKITLTILQVP